jgi:hypothetical protein
MIATAAKFGGAQQLLGLSNRQNGGSWKWLLDNFPANRH